MTMKTNSVKNQCGNFQELRNMWSLKAQAKPMYPVLECEQSSKESTSVVSMAVKTLSIPVIRKEPSLPPINTEKTMIFETVDKMPSIEEFSTRLDPLPPPKLLFQYQAQSVATIKQTLNKMNVSKRNLIPHIQLSNSGAHHWHIAKHVFRSGLIFNRTRRASDSILPLLIKTHQASGRSRADSIVSTLSQTPFESLINYITLNKADENDPSTIPMRTKRSTSDVSNCIRRNQLDDSIFQYESILRHLKNYEQFMSSHPRSSIGPSISSKTGEQSLESDLNVTLHEAEAKFLAKTSIPNRQTQSLSRNVGRTFSEFIINDLFSSTLALSSPSSKGQRCSLSHASSQTDSSEATEEIKDQAKELTEIIPSPSIPLEQSTSTINEETDAVLNEFDTILENTIQEPPITPNSAINVIIIQPAIEGLAVQKPLMQRLFEGKKSAYDPADLDMKTVRLSEELVPEYETTKQKCFFDSEQPVYVTKMFKIRRRGYTQHLRMLCITTERVYNITKKNPYPKEAVLFENILGITCTPYKDGFICIHTKEAYEDRGDWLVIVDHPCEFITQLFMILKRDNNNDHFLKFETKFQHCRRSFGEGGSSDCSIEARLSDNFHIKKADFDSVIIFTP